MDSVCLTVPADVAEIFYREACNEVRVASDGLGEATLSLVGEGKVSYTAEDTHLYATRAEDAASIVSAIPDSRETCDVIGQRDALLSILHGCIERGADGLVDVGQTWPLDLAAVRGRMGVVRWAATAYERLASEAN